MEEWRRSGSRFRVVAAQQTIHGRQCGNLSMTEFAHDNLDSCLLGRCQFLNFIRFLHSLTHSSSHLISSHHPPTVTVTVLSPSPR